MMSLVSQLKQTTQLKWNGISKFRSKVFIYLEFNSYIIKTAETQAELLECFKLRHEVFHREFRGSDTIGIDIDRYDSQFDHLIIVHKKTDEVVGTYRVGCSHFTKLSYVSKEFYLENLFRDEGPFLELGRACILKEHRNGAVISLLWRGIAQYMNSCGAQTLYGCASIKVNTPERAALLYQHFIEQNKIDPRVHCRPTEEYTMGNFSSCLNSYSKGLTEQQKMEAEFLTPSLLHSYLRMGALIISEPAYDIEFDCIDILTVLRKQNMPDTLAKKFEVIK